MQILVKSLLLPLCLLCTMLLSGCNALLKPLQPPQISLAGLALEGMEQGQPAVAVRLRVVNPNPQALAIKGVVYQLQLAGRRVVQGAIHDFAPIAGYGEGEVILRARPDWLQSARLLTDLLTKPERTWSFRLEAQIDPGSWYPTIELVEEGRLDLSK